jgi:hypothetical protein
VLQDELDRHRARDVRPVHAADRRGHRRFRRRGAHPAMKGFVRENGLSLFFATIFPVRRARNCSPATSTAIRRRATLYEAIRPPALALRARHREVIHADGSSSHDAWPPCRRPSPSRSSSRRTGGIHTRGVDRQALAPARSDLAGSSTRGLPAVARTLPRSGVQRRPTADGHRPRVQGGGYPVLLAARLAAPPHLARASAG